MFKIPHLLWRVCEGGIMKEFHRGKNAKSKLMEDDTMRSNLKIHMHSFKKLKGQKNLGYYTRFQICQVLNLLILILNWWATDSFLSGHFHTYGAEVTEFYSKDSYVRGVTHDPMCNAFPTVVSKILVRLTMRSKFTKTFRPTSILCIQFTKFQFGVFLHDQLNISKFLPLQICKTLIS